MGYATGSKNKKTTIDTHTGIIVHQSLFDIIAKTKVVTTEYRGLSEAEAEAMCNSDTYNYVNKSDFHIRGGWDPDLEIWTWYGWAPQAQGSESKATAKVIGDSHLWTVTVRVSTTTCRTTNGEPY